MITINRKFIEYWINLWTFLFCVAALAHSGHGGEPALVLILTALLLMLPWGKRGKYQLNHSEQLFIGLVLLFFSINLLGAFFQPAGLEFESASRQWRALDGPSRWLILLPILLLLMRYPINWRGMAVALSIGIFIATAIAIDQVFVQGKGRAYGATHSSIPFGEVMVVVDLFVWVLMIYAWNREERRLGALLLVAGLAAFYTAMLTGTRGALLAYGIMILVTIVQFYRRKGDQVKKIFSKVMVIRLLGFLVIFFLVSQTDQYQSIKNKSMGDLQRVASGEFQSVGGVGGGRGAMVDIALEGVSRYPLGVGTDNYRAIAKRLVEENFFGWDDGLRKHHLGFNQAHNEWMNVLVENGMHGLLILLLIFGSAARIFWRGLSDRNQLISTYAACGLMLIASYFVFGLTQAVFSHNSTTLFFLFFLYLFVGQIHYLGKKQEREGHGAI